MRSCIPIVLLALIVTGCGRNAARDKASGAAAAKDAPASAAKAPARPSKSLPEELADARAQLRAAIASGALDEVHVHALRVRDLAGALADRVTGLADADLNSLRALAAGVAQSAETIGETADRGDLVATRRELAALEAPLARLDGLVAKGEIEPGPSPKLGSHSVSLIGELIDPQCYFTHDARGPDHAACARLCARGGQDLAFLEESSGRVYPLISAGHGKNPNEGMIDHIGKPVAVEGVVFKRKQAEYLLIRNVTPHGGKN